MLSICKANNSELSLSTYLDFTGLPLPWIISSIHPLVTYHI